VALCRHCGHECHHNNGGKCHCGCLNCEHNIIEALNKLDEVLKLTKGVKFEADFDLTKN
jgi:hypothetical protein|tara:strand:+ start:426 stop:602 length:177 start_codon:yes stop_codon:yes gene_type:complete